MPWLSWQRAEDLRKLSAKDLASAFRSRRSCSMKAFSVNSVCESLCKIQQHDVTTSWQKTTQQPPHRRYIGTQNNSVLEESGGLAALQKHSTRQVAWFCLILLFRTPLGTRLTPPKRVMLNQAIHLHRQTRKLVHLLELQHASTTAAKEQPQN